MAVQCIIFNVNDGTIYEGASPLSGYDEFDLRVFPVQAPTTDTEYSVHLGWAEKTITFSRDGYTLKEWNTTADGTGTRAAVGDVVAQSRSSYIASKWYAIWEEEHSDPNSVSISLGVSEIATITDSGTEVLETNGTFLTDDITVDFTQGGNASVTVSLGNTTVTTMLSTSTEVLETSGTFLTDDITITLA